MNAHFKGEEFAGKKGLYVEVRNDDMDHALRILKKKMIQEGIPRKLKEKESYEKPGDRRRRKAAEAVRRWKKKQAQLKTEW